MWSRIIVVAFWFSVAAVFALAAAGCASPMPERATIDLAQHQAEVRRGDAEARRDLPSGDRRDAAVSWCASCGLALSGKAALCRHHAVAYGEDWAVANRIICDLIHRGVVPAASVRS
jgi:hypothetical protein